MKKENSEIGKKGLTDGLDPFPLANNAMWQAVVLLYRAVDSIKVHNLLQSRLWCSLTMVSKSFILLSQKRILQRGFDCNTG